MEASVWTSGIQTLPFLNCNFGIQNVPQELSNFVVWFGLDTVPRTLLNGQAGEIHPAHFNFTHGERNFQFSPRSALLFFVFQFSISRVQQADVNFDLLKSPVTLGSGCHVTFTSQMAVSGTDGTLTTLCILDQRLFS